MPDDVLEMIGTAALLEQLAEESAELAQAALKMARELAVYRQAGVAMFAGAKAIRDLIERGRRTHHQRIVHGMCVTNYDLPLAKAMDLLMQAGALAMNERDALRECASRTAAERLFNSLLR